MANKRISELPSAGTLTGSELVELVKGGINSQSTAQDVANLSNGANIDRYTFPFPQFDTATSTTAYTGTPSPAISSYATGQKFQVKIHATSTGAATLNLNGLGAKKVYTNPTTQATTGNLLIDQVYILVYDAALDAASGGFLMIGSSGGAGTPGGSTTQVQYNNAGSFAGISGATTNGTILSVTTPAKTVNTTQVASTEMVQARVLAGYVASGTGTYTATVDGITAYATGQVFDIQFTSANTANFPTLDVNTLGAKTLRKKNGINILLGEITPGRVYRVYYDGTYMVIAMDEVRVYNVESFGARHDYRTVSDANVTSGTATLTSATAAFTADDTGKSIRVFGAGAAGADLLTTMTFVNATTVTLGVNASTTIAAKQIEWGTDDTTPIQNTINNCFVNGGGTVWLPNGIYFLAGPLVTLTSGVNPNCQIYIPLSTLSEDKTMIQIVGESAISWPSGGLTAQNLPAKGVILKSVIVGSGTLPSVIGNSFYFLDINRNATTPIFRNICVMTKTMTGTTHVEPSMSGFMLRYCEAKQLYNCIALTESDPSESIVPSTVTYGFYLEDDIHTDSHSWYHDITASDYYYGVRVAEHTGGSKVFGYNCFSALAVGGSNYNPVGFGMTVGAIWCKYGITFLGAKTVYFNYYSEAWPGPYTSKWYDLTADFYWPSSVQVDGIINASSLVTGGTTKRAVTTSGTYTGNLVIRDLNNNIWTSVANDMLNLRGNGTRVGLIAQTTNSATQATNYLLNERSSFASYGGTLYGGSANSSGAIGGQQPADRMFLFSNGANNLGLLVGTIPAQPLILFSNNTQRISITGAGSLTLERTNTAAGTTGNRTINQMAGSVNFAAAATTLTVTNSLVATTSNIFVMIQTNDTTAEIKNVVPGAGSFVINMATAPTAETRVAFWVTN